MCSPRSPGNTSERRRKALISDENVLYRQDNEQTSHPKLPVGSLFFRGVSEEPTFRGVNPTRKLWLQRRVIGLSRKRPPTNPPPPLAGGLIMLRVVPPPDAPPP